MDRHVRGIILFSLLLYLVPLAASAGVFDQPELQVTPSPGKACSIQLDGAEKVIDYDVSPAGPEVAALVKSKDGGCSLVFWRIGAQETSTGWHAPAAFNPVSVVWHPRAHCLFISGAQGSDHHIMRLDRGAEGWVARSIFVSPRELRRLIAGPSPFVVGFEEKHHKDVIAHRLFFGMKNPDGTYRTVSVTEEGQKFYQVIGPAETFTHFKDAQEDPSRIEASFALPMAFHPAGHQLIWQDGLHHFHCASYGSKRWGGTEPLLHGTLKGGSVTPTPNGLGLLHWQASAPGIGLFWLCSQEETPQATGLSFVSTPSSVPDGRGIVGLTKSGQLYTLNFVPIAVPLADVMNAWMFYASDRDIGLLEKNRGLFRPLDSEQLYQLYESENYYCGGYDPQVPTRPYLVTTDIFWELFAAAYEGLFIVNEREQAIPSFWKFVSSAHHYYGNTTDPSKWRPVFKALADLHAGDKTNPETNRIRAADSPAFSETLGRDVDYGELKPRGYYTSTHMMQDYFKAFRYLTSVYADAPESEKTAIMEELKRLPIEVRTQALVWVASYQGFVSPSRAPLVWQDGAAVPPAYALHPNPIPVLFPLSWGFDNEVLLSTVYHPGWPPAEQVTGPGGDRLSPSGLDLAAALGSRIAGSLLEPAYAQYPPLKRVIKSLSRLYDAKGKTSQGNENLYDRWINALAVQWADDVQPPDRGNDEKIWRVKRLQTGLASWATLRHATVLVNERTAAECGEGGFEEIVLRAPRGYVEPDPRTFAAIAGLFDLAVTHVGQDTLKRREPMDEYRKGSQSLRQGIIRRLTATAKKARMFQAMAEKELRGETLTAQEYEEILYVGRVAEHHFLVFKSMANENHALSTPDPMAKIADVAGGGTYRVPFLMAAVGKPAEWDHVVPYFGRRQLVKGPVYSYYEFTSERLLDDAEWRNQVGSQARPTWVEPFFSDKNPSCPAQTRY